MQDVEDSRRGKKQNNLPWGVTRLYHAFSDCFVAGIHIEDHWPVMTDQSKLPLLCFFNTNLGVFQWLPAPLSVAGIIYVHLSVG